MSKSIKRIQNIEKKISLIESIVDSFNGKILKALEDEVQARPALLMHLVSIAEQINKLKNENDFEILEKFSKNDLKGLYDIRNFIAHDYEGVDLVIIENVLRYGIFSLKKSINSILLKQIHKKL